MKSAGTIRHGCGTIKPATGYQINSKRTSAKISTVQSHEGEGRPDRRISRRCMESSRKAGGEAWVSRREVTMGSS
jgi:hypothetical protein